MTNYFISNLLSILEINGLDTEEHGIGGFEGGGFEAWLKEKK